MSRFTVQTSVLRQVGASTRGVGAEVTGLAGRVSADLDPAAAAAPPGTETALTAFAMQWTMAVAQTGSLVQGIGSSTDAAASLYEVTDQNAIQGPLP